MDRGAPPDLLHEREQAVAAMRELHGRWHGHDRGRLELSVVPRFALSCTPGLLRAAAEFSAEHQLLIQTHISENQAEVRATLELFPDSRDYLGVYEDHGLAGADARERTILAHCIYLSSEEWARVLARDLSVAHCPDSNFFLGSGCMRLREVLERGIRVGLGTDVGAGRTFSLRRVIASAYDASLIVDAPVSPEVLLWLATRGGALALGKDEQIGCIAPGFEADLTVVDAPDELEPPALIDAICFRHDAGPVRATLVRGRGVL